MGCVADNSAAVFDDVSDGRWMKAVAGIRQWSRATRKPFIEIGWQLARERVSAVFVPMARAALNATQQGGADLLTARLRSLIDEPPGDALAAAGSEFPSSKRSLARQLLGYSREARLSLPALPLDMTYTYPFVHRPLVEFVLAIPGEELSAPERTRSLMRRAFAALLPPRIVERTSKGLLSAGRDAGSSSACTGCSSCRAAGGRPARLAPAGAARRGDSGRDRWRRSGGRGSALRLASRGVVDITTSAGPRRNAKTERR
jgi:Asparagine synthase.